MQNPAKSIVAVVAGMFLVIFLSVGTDLFLENGQIFRSIPLLLALLYRIVYAVMGGYVTSFLAPNNKMRHVMVLTVLGSFLGILGALANWGRSDQWYPISLVILSFFAVIEGGKLQMKSAPQKLLASGNRVVPVKSKAKSGSKATSKSKIVKSTKTKSAKRA